VGRSKEEGWGVLGWGLALPCDAVSVSHMRIAPFSPCRRRRIFRPLPLSFFLPAFVRL
jgi:hypothetical protein